MKKLFLKVMTGLLLAGAARAVDFQTNTVSTGNVTFARSARDTSGNLYLTGSYSNSFSYGGVSAATLASGLTGFFILKTDPQGNPVWLIMPQSTTVSSVHATAIAVDTSDGVYIGMSCANTTSGPQSLAFSGSISFVVNANSSDSIVAKYSQSAGAFVWAKTEPNVASSLTGLAVTADNASVIATGDFQGSGSFNATPLSASPAGARNSFLVKINATTGATTWAQNAVSVTGGYNRSGGIALDATGNIYTTGYFGGTMFPARAYQISAYSTALSNPSAYIVKWTNSSTVPIPQWAVASTDTSNSITTGNGIAVDVSSNVYVSFTLARTDPASTNVLGLNLTGVGGSTHYSQTNGGTAEGSIVKFDSNGNILWGTGTFGAVGSSNTCTRLAVTTNYVYALGSFGPGNVTFGGTTTLGSPGDSYILQLGTNGALGLVARANPTGAAPLLAPQDLIAATVNTNDTLNLVGTLGDGTNSYLAQYAASVPPFTYTITGGSNVTITGYTGSGGAVVIPSAILGVPVTAIGTSAFLNLSTITSVTIPNSVTSIGSSAFEYCSGLTNIVISNSVTSIGGYAFYYCSSLTSVTIPNSVYSIGNDAFYKCSSLTSVTIPASVTSIGSYAFFGCSALTNITVNSANPYFASTSGILFNKTLAHLIQCPGGFIGNYTIPNSVTSISGDAFHGCSGLTSVTIGSGVTSIGGGAFFGCSALTNAIIGSDVTTIGDNTFEFCSELTSVTIGNGVTSIGSSAFEACSSLTTVTIPSSVTSIGNNAFYDCVGLTSVTIPNSVTNIGQSAFTICSGLTNLLFLGRPPTLGSGVFSGVHAGAKVYYISGTTGWSGLSTYGGLPTVPITLPAISAPPASQTVALGANVTFNVTASGTATLGYQWYFASAPVNGANSASYSLNNVAAGDAGNYFVVVTNQFGSTTSSVAVLTVTVPSPFTFVTNSGAITITGYTGSGGAVNIPATINGYPVVAIGTEAFYNQGTITSVTISNSVTSIGSYAFLYCSGLTSVMIGNSVTSIGDSAFLGCSGLTNIIVDALNASYASVGGVLFDKPLTTLIQCPGGLAGSYSIPSSTTSISGHAFESCIRLTNVMIGSGVTNIGSVAFGSCIGLTNVVIPNNVTSIGSYAFNYCYGLTNVTIGSGVTSIGVYAFYYCSALTDVVLGSGITDIGSHAFQNCTALHQAYFPANAPAVDGAAGSADSTVFAGESGTVFYGSSTTGWGATFGGWNTAPSDLTYTTNSGAITITGYTGSGGAVNIPATINGYPVTAIGTSAFFNQGAITSVTISNSVTSLGNGVFAYCSGLKSVLIGSGVTSIGSDALGYCSGLTNISVDAANANFAGAGGVLFDKALTTLLQYPGGLAGSYAIPGSVTGIGYDAFANCFGLTGVGISNGVVSIGASAFANCSGLKSVVIPDSVTSLGNYAFSLCSGLTNVTLGSGVTSLGGGAFQSCVGLTRVTIPGSVTSLGSVVFYGCSALTNANFQGNAPLVNGAAGSSDTSVFNGETGTAYYLSGATGWVAGATFGGWPTVAIQTSPFTYTTNSGAITITGYTGTGGAVNIPSTINDYPVATIGTNAFYLQSAITSVTIPDSVTAISSNAFFYCSGITNVSLGTNLTSIGDYAFVNCSGLTSVLLPNSLTNIGNYAFSGCGLTSVTIPSGVTTVGNYAFNYCSVLASATFANCPADIGKGAFSSSGLISVALGTNLTSIGDYAFSSCAGLTNTLAIPDSVTSIGNQAFYGCGLTNLLIGTGVTNISANAFYLCTSLHQAYFQGNAPLVDGLPGSTDSTVFAGESGTVFYLPNTTGWGATFGSWPTAGPYQPQPQILGGQGLGVQNNQFGFTTFWATNASVVVQASTNLLTWTPLITNTLVSGTNAFTDSAWTNYPQRFYRVQGQ